MAPSDQLPKRQGILKIDLSDIPNAVAPSTATNPTPKSVSINPNGEHISPLILGTSKDVDELDLDRPRRPRVKGPASLRLSGRASVTSSTCDEQGETPDPERDQQSWVAHISQWIKDEKMKRDARHARRQNQAPASTAQDTVDSQTQPAHTRSASSHSVDLEALEQIIKDLPVIRHVRRKSSTNGLRRRLLRRDNSAAGASSDTEFFDGDALVPSAEVVLDNSNTLSYSGGAAIPTEDLSLEPTCTINEEAWLKFKSETLRLAHTLRLKGWRRVPLDMSNEVTIERLSGALTNAVYVVSPPVDLPEPAAPADPSRPPVSRRKPAKLLLRIYGPQVEHLIDRQSELAILGRLARKHIGPRMLGTFLNGRFEEFFNAAPLNPAELRNPDTSRHIAKRMRELHDGIDLLPNEREEGPYVWRNWDKWLCRVNKIVEWLDEQAIATAKASGTAPTFVCGAEWSIFFATVNKYRKWLVDQLGGQKQLRESMTQYGNILRMIPSSTSPLLLPANSHKQLVVIDFEYANANTPGFEFANHFSEWCYNYHDTSAPWRCAHALYPNAEEQARFVRAYVRHRPDFNAPTTPLLAPATSLADHLNEARGPPTPSVEDAALARENAHVKDLMAHTRLWRMAASAQWIAWGIVQARMPGLPTFEEPSIDGENVAKPVSPSAGPVDAAQEADAEAAEEEFDYLAYTRDRAMLFWGDALELGLVQEQDLPAGLAGEAKRLKY